MNCELSRSLMCQYILGELDGDIACQVEDHLTSDQCDCKEAFADLNEVLEASADEILRNETVLRTPGDATWMQLAKSMEVKSPIELSSARRADRTHLRSRTPWVIGITSIACGFLLPILIFRGFAANEFQKLAADPDRKQGQLVTPDELDSRELDKSELNVGGFDRGLLNSDQRAEPSTLVSIRETSSPEFTVGTIAVDAMARQYHFSIRLPDSVVSRQFDVEQPLTLKVWFITDMGERVLAGELQDRGQNLFASVLDAPLGIVVDRTELEIGGLPSSVPTSLFVSDSFKHSDVRTN